MRDRISERMIRRTDERGYAYLEVLAAVTILATVLLSVASMFLTAYHNVDRSGKTTVTVALTRQLFEDMRSIPFDSVQALDGFDTADPGTLPADEPERGIARRWRFAVAGQGSGWSYTTGEIQAWSDYGTVGATTGIVAVSAPTASMRQVTVTLTMAGRPTPVRMVTLITRTES